MMMGNMIALPPKWILLVLASTLVHVLMLFSLKSFSESELGRLKRAHIVSISLHKTEKKAEPLPLPTPVPTIVEKPKAKKIVSLPKEKKDVIKEKIEPVPEVHGLTAKSFLPENAPGTGGATAVAGNTLMIEDTGVRAKLLEIVPLPASESLDKSEAARLDFSSLKKPEYTKEALKVRLKGDFPVDVHVAPDGVVLEVEFSRAVGYGMDARIKDALLGAKFFPERDRAGTAVETWVTIQFRLEMP